MASRHTLQKECDRYNAVRQVRFHRGACSLEGFWSSARGNFLLTGGTESRRSEILAEGIREMAGTARGPIVVLYTSLDLENRLIQMAQKGELPGYLTVSSPATATANPCGVSTTSRSSSSCCRRDRP